MVSKLIVVGTLFLGAVFAEDVKLESKDFEEAICIKSYKPHAETKDLKLAELIPTHGCSDKATHICLIETKDAGHHLMCSAKANEAFKLKDTDHDKFKLEEKFELRGKPFADTITKIECEAAKHTYKHDLKEALLVMHDKKETLKELGEVKDKHSLCMVVIEEEPKKEGDKKDDKDDKKEIKKISKVYWFTVAKENYKPTEKVEEITILETKYKGLHCGKKEDLEKEAKTFAVENASGCCSCAWYVWVIIAVVIVGAGVGAYFVLKEDKEEDEFEAEYGTTA